jgi:hypothetical protein
MILFWTVEFVLGFGVNLALLEADRTTGDANKKSLIRRTNELKSAISCVMQPKRTSSHCVVKAL